MDEVDELVLDDKITFEGTSAVIGLTATIGRSIAEPQMWKSQGFKILETGLESRASFNELPLRLLSEFFDQTEGMSRIIYVGSNEEAEDEARLIH